MYTFPHLKDDPSYETRCTVCYQYWKGLILGRAGMNCAENIKKNGRKFSLMISSEFTVHVHLPVTGISPVVPYVKARSAFPAVFVFLK